MTDKNEDTPPESQDSTEDKDTSPTEQNAQMPAPNGVSPSNDSFSQVEPAPSEGPGTESEAPVPEAALQSADMDQEPPAAESEATETPQAMAPQHGTAATGGAPGSMMGMIILLLVASIIGGLIVSLWPGKGGDRPVAALSSDVEARLKTAESRIATLEKQVDDTKQTAQALEAAIQSGEGGATSSEAVSVIRDIQNRIAALENTAGQINAAVPGAEETDGSALLAMNQQLAALKAGLNSRLDQLEKTAPPADLEQRLDRLAPTDMVNHLSDRVTALEADKSGLDAQKAALTLAVANLSRATLDGQPFESELQAVALVAPDLAVPASIAALAQNGVPSTQSLVDEFGELSFAALRADRQKAGASWMDQLQANFDTVFAIRRKGEMEGESTEAILARADARLTKKDLSGALDELKHLEGPAAETMSPWVKEAGTRLELEAYLKQMNKTVVERLATDGSNQ